MGKYIVRIEEQIYKEKSKDDVIAILAAQFNARTGNEVEVIWPDKSHILERGFD